MIIEQEKTKHTQQWKRIENPQINLYICAQLTDKGARTI